MQHTKPIFVFDWDDVISATDRLRELTYELLLLSGLDREQIRQAGKEVRHGGGYHFHEHAKLLAKQYPEKEVALEAIRRIFDKARDHLGSVIYPDAEKFLHRVAARYPLAVITAGNTDFQQQKIHRSGLAHLFSHMLFVPESMKSHEVPQSKSRALGQLLELYPTILYFDDRADTLATIYDQHKHHQRILPLRVMRNEKPARYSHVITSFDHPLPPIIEKLLAEEVA